MGRMDAHERATSVWYRVAGLLRRKDLAVDIIGVPRIQWRPFRRAF